MNEFPSFLRVGVNPTKQIFEITDKLEEEKRFSGTEADFLYTLADALKFKFKVVAPSDKLWGSIDESGNWTGVVGMLTRNDVDIGLSYLDITEARLQAVDFIPYDIADKTFATPYPQPQLSHAAFTYVFRSHVWLSILAAYLVITFVFTLLSPKHTRWSKILFDTFGTLCKQPFPLKGNNSNSLKAAFASWGLFVFVITSSYSAVLFSVLAIPGTVKNIATISELASVVEQGSYEFKISEGTHDLQILLGSMQEELNTLGEIILKNNWFYDTTDLALARFVKPNTAIMANRALIATDEFHNKFISPDSFGIWNIGIAFRKTFCCKDRLNTVILRTLSSGMNIKHRRDRFAKNLVLNLTEEPNNKRQILLLKELYGVFITLLLGYMLSIVVFVCELIYFYVYTHVR